MPSWLHACSEGLSGWVPTYKSMAFAGKMWTRLLPMLNEDILSIYGRQAVVPRLDVDVMIISMALFLVKWLVLMIMLTSSESGLYFS
jgi:hypothetical protein